MQQLEIDEDLIVYLDYESDKLPPLVRQLKPVLFEEDDHFCCILGPDMEHAVMGRGATEDEAISNWTADCKQRMQNKNPDDTVAQYLRDTLSASKYDIN